MYSFIAQKRSSFFIVFLVTTLLTLLSSVLFLSQPVYARLSSIEGGCTADGITTGYSSPFTATKEQCLGRDTSRINYYQFAVELPSAIKNIEITMTKATNGQVMKFVKEGSDGLLYVSKPVNGPNAGFPVTLPDSNDECKKIAMVTIKAKAGGKEAAPITYNLCDYGVNRKIIYSTINDLVGDNGTTSTKGRIEGNIGILREGAPADDARRQGTIEKSGIISIKLSGQASKNDVNGSWYTLSNGNLRIDNLDPGTYDLKIHYNDCLNPGILSNWTSCDIPLTYPKIVVVAGKPTIITAPDGSIQYYNVKGEEAATATTTEKTSTTCGDEVPGVGWMICPLIDGFAGLNDSMWGIVSSLLKVNPLNQSDKIYEAWGVIRNIANVAFVIVFLIMIFSQISNFGISNYGIKKLLPRLIIGAILVNISFLIMQIVVDLANIVGSGLYDLIAGLVGSQVKSGWKIAINMLLVRDAAGATIAGIVLTGNLGAVFWMLLPMLAIGALSLLAAVFTLIFRQAIIPILAILAPLAFVAYLLPNTESWYKKWQKMLMSTLLLYPLAAVIFGGSKFASNIMIGDGKDFWKMLIGLIILVFPLFSLPFIASKGGAMVGAVGGFLTGLASKAKSPLTNVGKEYSNRAKLQADNKALNDKSKINPRGWNLQRRARNEAISQNQKSELDRSRAEYIAKTIGADDGFVERMTKGSGASAIDRAKARAISSIGKIEDDQIKDAITLYNSEKGPEYGHSKVAIDYEDAVRKGDTTKTLALQDILRNSGAPGVASLHEKLEKLENDGVFNSNEKLRFSVKRDILKAGLKGKDAGLNAWSYSDSTQKLYNLSRSEETFKSLTNEELAGQSSFVLDIATDSTKGGKFTIDHKVAEMILANQNTSQKLGNNGTMKKFKEAAGIE